MPNTKTLSQAFRKKRLLLWLILAAAYMTVYFHRVSINVVADRLMADFAIDGAVLGSLAAMYSNMYLIMQLPGGALVDHWGAKKTVTAGTFLVGAGSVVFGLAPSIFYTFFGRFLIGLGGSAMLLSILRFTGSWYRKDEFATMSGLVLLAGNVGAFLATNPLAYFVEKVGWRLPFQAFGVFTILIAFACLVFVKSRPEELGYETVVKEDEQEKKESIGIIEAIKITMTNKGTWAPFWINFGMYSGVIAFSGAFGIYYLMQIYNITREQASFFMVLTAVGMALGAPVAGYISDKMGDRRRPFQAFVFLCFLCWFYLVVTGGRPPFYSFYPLSFLMGFSSGSVMLSFACAKEANPPSIAGAATATVNIGNFLGISILQPLFGYLLDFGWQGKRVNNVKVYPLESYRLAFIACLLFALVALIASFFLENKSNSRDGIRSN